MGFVENAVRAGARAASHMGGGADRLASTKRVSRAASIIDVRSPEFEDGAPLPISATIDGAGIAPTIAWGKLPDGTRSVLLLCEDPDAPHPQPFVHWILFGIPPGAGSVGDGAIYLSGKNGKLTTGFTPAAPPPGHGIHHYHFQIFALDRKMDLAEGTERAA
jgi:Raf kinase inhibitor-like YbhB/YbcL family protein